MSEANVHAFVCDAANKHKAKQQQKEDCANKRFPLRRFKDIQLDRANTSLIKQMLPRTGIGLVWGEPKTFKSFWTFDVAMHIAREDIHEYRGLRVKTGPVVYCAFEGGGGFGRRIAAYRKFHRIPDDADIPFILLPVRVDLIRDHPQLIASIEEQLGVTPSAVILDTLNQSLVGSESSDEDMAAYLGAAEAIYSTFDCLVLVVHHCGHNTDRYRGHSSLGGTIVVEIAIRRAGDGTITSTVVCARDDEAGKTLTHEMVRVDLGLDADGDPMSSLVCVQARQGKKAERGPVWPRSLRMLHDALREALLEHGRQVRPFGAEGPAVRAVASEHVQRLFCERHPAETYATKVKKYTRNLESAVGQALVVSRTYHGTQNLWFASGDKLAGEKCPADPHFQRVF